MIPRKTPFMPTLSAQQLRDLGTTILKAAGVPAADAAIVAEELAEANLVVHDSHGVMRLVQYVQMIKDNHVRVGADLEVLVDEPAYAVLDAHFNLGQVASLVGLQMAIQKAKSFGTATV